MRELADAARNLSVMLDVAFAVRLDAENGPEMPGPEPP
jgi:hypothetical protein